MGTWEKQLQAYSQGMYAVLVRMHPCSRRRCFDNVLSCCCCCCPQVSLKYFEEVFTSQHWMMRIYRVRDTPNRDAAKDSGRTAQRKTLKMAAA